MKKMKLKKNAFCVGAVLLCAALTVFSASCNKNKQRGGAGVELGAGKISVILLTDQSGIDDRAFNEATWKGIKQFYNDPSESMKGNEYDFLVCQTDDSYIPNLRQVSEQGWDLIIASGDSFANALEVVSDEFPEQKYMNVDVPYIEKPNVARYLFSEEEGSYLVGAAAALQARKDGVKDARFGFIGGVPGSTITKFEMGYIQGIKSVMPGAEIVDYYANDWGRPDLAKTQAKAWYDSGVYAVFCAAGATGNGAIAQAKEYRGTGKNIWAIGVDTDQYEDGIYSGSKSAVLTSMIKRVDAAALLALDSVQAGTYKGDATTLNLAAGGVDFSKSNPELTSDIIAQVEKLKDDIAEGKIKIASSYKEAQAAGLAPSGLGAKDDG